jgi:aminoglycoside phosphotransferase (APT) family kinase protein
MTLPRADVGEPDEVLPVRAGQDMPWDRLGAYLGAHLPDLKGDLRVEQFPHGSANLTYRVWVGHTPLVVRRPPLGSIAPGAHDMRREYRALVGLWPHFDRAPVPYLFCDDHSVIGSDFIVVEYRRGVGVWGRVPASMAHHPDAARRMGFAVVEALADLHLVDPASTELVDLGKPRGFVGRQLSGWAKRWTLVDTGRIPTMARLIERLTAAVPAESPQSSVLHNDAKPDNCQFDPSNPDRVKSMFDWDMATLGDPLVDLGTLLTYWPDTSDTELDVARLPAGLADMGLPARAEVVDRYVAQTGFDVTNIAWYEAFATWKLIVVLEQLYHRHASGGNTDTRLGELGRRGPDLAVRLDRMLARGV